MAAVLDTHAAVWYLLKSPSLSSNALYAIERALQSGEPVFVPSICLVEIIYLVEKCRLPMAALDRLMMAFDIQSMALRVAPLDVDTAMFIKQIPRDAVPDMPDRIIAATALRLGLPLVSRDQRMTTAGIEIIW